MSELCEGTSADFSSSANSTTDRTIVLPTPPAIKMFEESLELVRSICFSSSRAKLKRSFAPAHGRGRSVGTPSCCEGLRRSHSSCRYVLTTPRWRSDVSSTGSQLPPRSGSFDDLQALPRFVKFAKLMIEVTLLFHPYLDPR